MEQNDQGEGIVADAEATNEVEETTEETTETKVEKPKRTPQEELEYFEGRAARLRKKLGVEESKADAPKPETPDKPNDLDYGEKAYLRSALNLKGSDELQLARDWKAKYSSTVEEMESDEVFLNRLTSLREARESAAAIPKGKGRSGQSGTTDVDIAYAKFEETGQMPADFKTRVAIKNRLIEKEKSSGIFTVDSQ